MPIARQRIQLPQAAWRSAIMVPLRAKLRARSNIEPFESVFSDFIVSAHAVTVPSGRAGFRFTFEALNLDEGAEVI